MKNNSDHLKSLLISTIHSIRGDTRPFQLILLPRMLTKHCPPLDCTNHCLRLLQSDILKQQRTHFLLIAMEQTQLNKWSKIQATFKNLDTLAKMQVYSCAITFTT